jgi:hypothetical protein
MTSNAGPFETIESAQEFLGLLRQAIGESLDEAGRHLAASAARERLAQVDAWRVVLHKMTTLSSHVAHSERLAGELRMLRDRLQGADGRAARGSGVDL